ncbi:MAG: 16S rRNA (cytosine(1402)-N(4))-methyltransferase RsmH [Candidatus Doudnabacteria bacterium]
MHVPVLLKEVLEYLNVQKGKKFVDGTAGGGGHIFAIKHANPKAKILGIDLDQTSLDNLQTEVDQKGLGQTIELVQGNYRDIDKILSAAKFGSVDGILVDLGFSSMQLDHPDRGFSFQQDSPLDMRYDTSSKLTAADVVNRYHQKELEKVIAEFGEDRFYRRIAQGLIASRKAKPIETTSQLAESVRKAVPPQVRFKANDNIRRVFQAIRIEVNRELENLKIFLPKALDLLTPAGRLVIISFHSLEDRIVKEFFREQAKDCICPPEFPMCVCGKASKLRILTRKPVTATEQELEENPKSKPAKLRACEKIESAKKIKTKY